jgi:hypothetical protein
MKIIKMITTFIMGAVLSYFTIRVTSHYLAKNGVFDLANPAEFISVFATVIFYTLFSYKACNELEEVVAEEIKNIPYAEYEEIERN